MAKKKSPNKKAPPLKKPQDTFRDAVEKFRKYKETHPNGRKKMSEFIHEEFLKRK